MWLILAVALVVFSAIKAFYKELLYFTFDTAGAEAIGLPVQLINFSLMAAITLTIVAGIQTVGVILVVALMVTPAVTAFLLVKELHWMMLVGAALGALGSVLGMYVSFLSRHALWPRDRAGGLRLLYPRVSPQSQAGHAHPSVSNVLAPRYRN